MGGGGAGAFVGPGLDRGALRLRWRQTLKVCPNQWVCWQLDRRAARQHTAEPSSGLLVDVSHCELVPERAHNATHQRGARRTAPPYAGGRHDDQAANTPIDLEYEVAGSARAHDSFRCRTVWRCRAKTTSCLIRVFALGWRIG